MQELVFASFNKHKVDEIQLLLGNAYKVSVPSDFGIQTDIPETGNTLSENAKIKAIYIHKLLNRNCFSDDSGLEVEALDGKPGVHSARYAGDEKDSEKNIDKVLAELSILSNRKASFKTVICLIYKDQLHEFVGEIKGEILKERRGNNGFGYDAVFIPDGYTKSFAEMSSEQKAQISHRAKAIEQLIAFLKTA